MSLLLILVMCLLGACRDLDLVCEVLGSKIKNGMNSRRSIPFLEELCISLSLRGVDGFQGSEDDFLVLLSGGTD
jgi:hypothetical protein